MLVAKTLSTREREHNLLQMFVVQMLQKFRGYVSPYKMDCEVCDTITEGKDCIAEKEGTNT